LAGRVYAPRGYARYATLTTVKRFSDAPTAGVVLPTNAIRALIQNQHATVDIRWRDDDVSPTASEGMLLRPQTTLEYDGDLTNFQFIEAAAGGVLAVSYYGV